MEKTFQLYYTSDTHGRLFPKWTGAADDAAANSFAAQGDALCSEAVACDDLRRGAGEVLLKSDTTPCLTRAFAEYQKDENTLVLDGGDTLQGSPLLRYLWKTNQCAEVLSAVMNSARMDYYTLGNHDFNYGYDGLAAYVRGMNATCVCANVKDTTADKLDIRPYVIHTLGNGLRIGIVGVVTDWVNVWEAEENLEGLQVTDAFTAAKEALLVLKSVENAIDYTICIYHGGFEESLQPNARAADVVASAALAQHLCAEAVTVDVGSAKQMDDDLEQLEKLEQLEQPEQLVAATSTKRNVVQQSTQPLAPENIACAICKELDFDLLLTAHQHMEQPATELYGTAVLQLPPNAEKYAKLEIAAGNADGVACGDKAEDATREASKTNAKCKISKSSEIGKSGKIGEAAKNSMDKSCKCILRAQHIKPTAAPSEALLSQMQPYRRAAAQWLAQPAGSLANDMPAQPDKIALALGAAPLAQLANFAQLNASGAEVAITSLPNHACALPKEITVGDLLTAYPFPNAVMTLAVKGVVLAKGIARSASYFAKVPNGDLQVAAHFMQPKEEHYNYDFFAGVSYTISFEGENTPTVTEILVNGEPLDLARTYTVVMSDYRASGTGGYPFYASCPRLASHPVDLQALLLDTLAQHPQFEIPVLSKVKVARG